MNILIIPSWYPTKNSPLSGIFFKEQAIALAKYYPKDKFTVCYWHDYSIKEYWKILFLKNIFKKTDKNLTTYIIKQNIILPNKLSKFIGGLDFILSRKIKCLVKLFKDANIDIIHAHVSYPSGYLAMLLSFELKIPYIITEHMSPFPFKSYPFIKNNLITKYVSLPLKYANKVVAVSNALANRIESFGFKRPIVIPNMVNENVFKPFKSFQAKEFVFFSLSILSKQKGIDILINAFARLISLNYKVKLVIGGDGAIKGSLKFLAKQLKVSQYIQWLNYVSRDNAVKYYNECSCFILPSRHETFGIVYAEAIACGKPIIATKCGGPEDIVNEHNGLLCEVGNIFDLTEKMCYMIDNYEKYDSKIIREDFDARFSQKIVSKRIFEVYNQVRFNRCVE